MGKTMPKSTIIYGQQHAVAVSSFSSSHVNAIMDVLRDKVGADIVDPRAGEIKRAINGAVSQAKSNKKMKDAYVKIGLIAGDLVLRCKEKRFFGDIEIDAVLIKAYKPKAARYAEIKKKQALEALDKSLAQLEERVTKQREDEARRKREARETQMRQWQEELGRRSQPKPTTEPTVRPRAKSTAKKQEEVETQETQTQEVPLQTEPVKPKPVSVMDRKNEDGETVRERLLRAAKKGQKLGVGRGTQDDLDQRGLTEMSPAYHGEVLDHQKNRYGRYLEPLIEVWRKADPGMDLSKWLDEVEKGTTSVKGVTEARAITHREVGGTIVGSEGIAGGLVDYLDDTTRKPYEARVNKGQISGGNFKTSAPVIFVIGSDNKVYIGNKARGSKDKKAFNHSSFFSGGPVRSAGTLKVSGSAITEVNELSGHYAPSRAMVATAVRKFAGGDQDWLRQVNVVIGSKTMTGRDFLDEDANVRARQTWGKYSHGALHRDKATELLLAGEDGAWLVREGSDGSFAVSFRKGSTVNHRLVADLGQLGLDRKKLVPPTEKPGPTTLSSEHTSQLRNSPAYHGNINRAKSEELLNGKPEGTWLLREGRGRVVALSRVAGGKIEHWLMDSEDAFAMARGHMQKFRTQRVTA